MARIPKLIAQTTALEATRADVVALLIFSDKAIFDAQMKDLRRITGRVPAPVASQAFTAKEGETLLVTPNGWRTSQLVLVGVGRSGDMSRETLRRGAATACKMAGNLNARILAIGEPDMRSVPASIRKELEDSQVVQALGEGALLAAYRFDKYKSKERPKPPRLSTVAIICQSADMAHAAAEAANRASVLAKAVYLARDLSNAPGNEIYPHTLAQEAKGVSAVRRIAFTVFDERQIRRLKMGGIVGVAQGSAKPPRFIVMEYRPRRLNKSTPTVVLVGKGVTFDSGGISIKPAANMAEMKMDMSGGAAVIGTLQAVADLSIPVRVVGLIPAVENLPGGRALKPGDILRHVNGKTSEVDNTDAEGRLILADALAYASRYRPDLVIDLATLTGAVVVALGHVATGMMGTDKEAMERMKRSGERTYERVWELPLFREYEKLIKSDIADVKNVGGRWAGAITGALFLKNFVGTTPWIHLDIAGTAMIEEGQEYIPKGASGVGVRLLTDFLQEWK